MRSLFRAWRLVIWSVRHGGYGSNMGNGVIRLLTLVAGNPCRERSTFRIVASMAQNQKNTAKTSYEGENKS